MASRPLGRFTPIGAAALTLAAALLPGCQAPSMTDQQWEEQVIAAPTPVLVEFYRDHCPICHELSPRLNMLASEYDGRVALYKINTDTTWPLAKKNHVRWLPTVVLFLNGREIKRWLGEGKVEPYRRALDAVLSGKPID